MTTTTSIAARAVDASKIYGSGETVVRALDGLSVDLAAGQFTPRSWGHPVQVNRR